MKTKKVKKLKIKKQVIFKSIAFFIIGLSCLVFLFFVRLELLPFKYLAMLFIVLLLIDFMMYFLLSKKNYKLRMIGSILSIFLIFFFSVLMYYQNATISFLHQISFLDIETEAYEVIVKNNSSYGSIKDLKSISYVDDRKGISKALKEVSKEKQLKETDLEDASKVIDSLLNNKVDAIIMEQEEANLYLEMIQDFRENYKIIKTISVDVQNERIMKDIKMTSTPFSVYLTGIDTYGKLNKVSRSDVNIVMTVNPKTAKILLISIPRDYYVQISGTTGLKDKLTHAGLKGVDVSMKTIENILETEIPYYVKINFTSLIDIVDSLEGIDVDNPFEFTAYYQEEDGKYVYYKFLEGQNHLDGKKALAYVRERYGLREGDIARARHQHQVIESMTRKLMSPTILTKYTDLLNSIEGNFATNISISSIKSLIEMQLEKNMKWEIESIVLTGSESKEKTAAFPDLYSSVIIPDDENISEIIKKINTLKEE